jgi:hypothetical protein
VGIANFSGGGVNCTALALNNAGTPYVVYEDSAHGELATVMKYNGTAWVPVGAPAVSTSDVYYTTIAIDKHNTPYIAYSDGSTVNGQATVLKFNGASWETVGSRGFTPGSADWTSIALDTNGVPYVAFEDFSVDFAASVMKFDGTGWVNVGSPGFTSGGAFCTSLVFDKTKNIPYLAYEDFNVSEKASVMTYSDSGWTWVGSRGFSAGEVWGTGIALSPTGIPFVVYDDMASTTGGITVMAFDGPSAVPNVAVMPTTLYPNPAETELAVSQSGEIGELCIRNALGQTVFTGNYAGRSAVVDVSGLPSESYFLYSNGHLVGRFTKL